MPVKTGTVQVTWPTDEGTFYRKLVDTVAANPGFSGVGSAALFQPAHEPALRFYRQSRSNKPGQSVKLKISVVHWPGRTPAVSDVQIEDANPHSAPAPLGPPPPAQLSAPATKWAEVVIGFLEGSSKHGHSKAQVDFLQMPGALELRRYKALDEGKVGPRPVPLSARKAATELLSLLTAGSESTDTRAYASQFEIVGGEWSLRRIDLVATIKPLPEKTSDDEDDDGDEFLMTDEGEAIIADIKATRQLILSTAATLIAEQDPTRIDNLLMSVAPFALLKIGKLAKLARFSKLSKASILGKIKIPRAVQVFGGRYHVPAKLNPTLVERALELRKTKFGVEFKNFKKINVSVWEVKINGKPQLFEAGNIPISDLKHISGTSPAKVGLHSEGFIAQHLSELKNRGNKVSVVQIYTERPPCPRCAELLREYSESPVFHSLYDGPGSKAERLMQAYGVTP